MARTRFTPTERRTLALSLVLLGLGTAARLLLSPGAASYAWTPASSHKPSATVEDVRRAVADTLARVAESARPLAAGETIEVNRADAVQLQRLPGVGAARAKAIVDERETGGPFASVADLARVRGVGPGLLERWAGAIRVEAPNGLRPDRGGAAALVDLNRAQLKELQQITGIGPALAKRIVEARARRGSFQSLEDLLDVPGIGPKTLEVLRNQALVR